MSRVHDALRRAENSGTPIYVPPPPSPPAAENVAPAVGVLDTVGVDPAISLRPELLQLVRTVPFNPLHEAHLLNASHPHVPPAEEFRTLRTRLNHLQSLQPISSIVITSPSPAEGKSFAACNLALAEAQLEDNRTLLVDCDFRRPNVHNKFQIERTPGLTDFLQGKATLDECIVKVEGLDLYILPAGTPVINPLELLNLREMRTMMEQFRTVFNWVIVDSPPLLFAADANLLSTICSGTVLVVRMSHTTIDSVTRAMQSLCENNVLGVIVNAARRGELYSKYTYYHEYYYADPAKEEAPPEPVVQ
jgi:protein-tyrosine kinase